MTYLQKSVIYKTRPKPLKVVALTKLIIIENLNLQRKFHRLESGTDCFSSTEMPLGKWIVATVSLSKIAVCELYVLTDSVGVGSSTKEVFFCSIDSKQNARTCLSW